MFSKCHLMCILCCIMYYATHHKADISFTYSAD